ncbi:ABC-type transport auxiliary lipoprotein family protein [Undibacterium sp. Di26W]|uniref:ABC-type transport auxiliary lipoprotein family protein n=1 Tax=Undibacterium sp. Di26W TaxID=3413035 RepID=UPI003BF019E5
MNYRHLHQQLARLRAMISISLFAILSACSSTPVAQRQQYDFGPWLAETPATPLPGRLQFSLTEIAVPAALESNAMLYRLQYDNVQQLKAYSQHRWSMPPAQLLAQRLKTRMANQGSDVMLSTEAASPFPVLRIELEEFSQIFSSPNQSHAQISLRASLVKGRQLLAQKSFQQKVNAASADAPGGAKAMQEAADASIDALQTWIKSLPLN